MKNHVANGSHRAHGDCLRGTTEARVFTCCWAPRTAVCSRACWAADRRSPAQAQQASQPGFDPRQTERRFDDLQSGAARRRAVPTADAAARPAGGAGGYQAAVRAAQRFRYRRPRDSADRLVTAYQPYLGKKVSQADLAAIAAAISDIYRAAGFHLSRAIVPPQDIRDGQLRIQVIEGSITEVALKGDGAEQFGVRPMLDPGAGRTALATGDAGAAIAADQRPARRAHRRHRARRDRHRDRPFPPRSSSLKTWHLYTSFGVDNLGSSAVGPWQSYATAAFNSYLAARRHAGAQSVDHARRSAPARIRPAVLRGAGRHRRRAARRVRALQRGPARRLQAPVQRHHQDRILRDPRQHRSAAIAEDRR